MPFKLYFLFGRQLRETVQTRIQVQTVANVYINVYNCGFCLCLGTKEYMFENKCVSVFAFLSNSVCL